jgi:hypothetical protein
MVVRVRAAGPVVRVRAAGPPRRRRLKAAGSQVIQGLSA